MTDMTLGLIPFVDAVGTVFTYPEPLCTFSRYWRVKDRDTFIGVPQFVEKTFLRNRQTF